MAGLFTAVTTLRPTTNKGSKADLIALLPSRSDPDDSCSIIDFILCLRRALWGTTFNRSDSLLLAATLLLDLRLRLPGAR